MSGPAHSGLHYFPVTLPFLLLLAGLLGLVLGIAALRVLRYAAGGMGISLAGLAAILVLSLLGSYINIPLAHLSGRQIAGAAQISFFGVTYVVPVVRQSAATILAINVGGALIPIALSLYLIARHRLLALSVVGVAIVAIICHLLARPVPGLGIAEPVMVPALTTAIVAMVLSRRHAAPLAYISGSLGTLIGADLLNLGRLQAMGAPVASIGGAGTFDGIFLTGLLAVLYASLAGYARR
ncbi:MAG TPA: DUF1614 domain-containing protein [Steroidobacteraceae bacterium]|jgi:uncharacterized membrane protein|nr:DUF1614 domain-containing protein [Steroidobacteraceae bacterium]